MLSKWNSFLNDKFDMDSFFGDIFNENIMGIEQKEEDGNIVFSIDMPGVKESDISVEISDDLINIKGERKTSTSSYTIHKTFSLPQNCDSDSLEAQLNNGVLTFKLKVKSPTTKEKRKIVLKPSEESKILSEGKS